MTAARPKLLASLASVVALLAAGSTQAYVRYKAPDGSGYKWAESCVHITGYPTDFPDMTAADVSTAATAAASAWTNVSLSCTYLAISVELSSMPSPRARRDFKNSLIFRHADWCSPNDSPWVCSYDEAALAITTVFTDGRDGRIQDADIEVNSRWFQWGDLAVSPDKSRQDLQNALTHEMGHLIGLDHTCYSPSITIVPPKDQNGNDIPTCADAPAAVRATTMFASAVAGDLTKRTLEADDQQAVCDIYPLSADPVSCPNTLDPSDKGCAVAPLRPDRPGGVLGTALATMLVAAGLAARWRSARRRQRPG